VELDGVWIGLTLPLHRAPSFYTSIARTLAVMGYAGHLGRRLGRSGLGHVPLWASFNVVAGLISIKETDPLQLRFLFYVLVCSFNLVEI
jgi:hypothetical protein